MDYFRAMIKYLFIVINSLSLFFLGLVGGDGVTITSTIPSTINAGQEIPIELHVNKGSMTGFARLELTLPEGISIKNSEEHSASYSFEEGIAKWVWAVLPEDNEIMIKATLVASETASGAKAINAKYSYVENNNKQSVDMEPVTLTVVNANATAVMPDSTAKAGAMPMASSNSEPPGKISAERIITKTSDTEYLVVLKIKKGITKGFAKYIDDVVGQLTTKAIKTDGSSFSVADGKIKFVWVNVPQKDEMEISYTLGGNFTRPIILNGEYSYLEDNQSKKYKLNPDTVRPTPVKEVPETNLQPAEPSVTEKQPETKTEGNMIFAVQIGAFTNTSVGVNQLQKQFNISEPIRSEMQGGFSKFMVGSHAEYKNARQHRETIKSNGVKTAFVVAYNGAKRVTVQEALMASNQKWFK